MNTIGNHSGNRGHNTGNRGLYSIVRSSGCPLFLPAAVSSVPPGVQASPALSSVPGLKK